MRDERDRPADDAALAAEEEGLRRRLEEAGPRSPIPPEDLAAISAAAHAAWREAVQRRAGERRRPGGGTIATALTSWRRQRVRRRGAVAAALAALLLVALGIGWWWRSRPQAPPPVVARVEAVVGLVRLEVPGEAPAPLAAGAAVPAGAVLSTAGAGDAAPGRAALRLAGGGELRLDAGTRLRLLAAASLELAAGAVYADTGTDGAAGTALVVHTPLGVVRDVGTRFAVALDGPADPVLRVRVRDGRVVVEQGGRSDGAGRGEELVVRGGRRVERRRIAVHGSAWDWVMAASPAFEVEGRTLGELLAWVARETGWRVRFVEPGLAAAADEIVLHGDFGDLRPDQAAFAVLPGAGLEGELADGVLVVRRPVVTSPR